MRFTRRAIASKLPGLSCAIAGYLALAACHSPTESTPVPASAQFKCAPRTGGAAELPQEWQRFGAHIDECSLHAADGKVALRVVTVSAQRYYASKPDGAVTEKLPQPLILSATGSPLGRLPYSYPDDPPFAADLEFEQWRDGMPRLIRIAVHDPTVTGDHGLVMNWDESKREYVGGAEK